MLEDAQTDLSNRGEIVLDPLLGSRSTLIATQNTGRVAAASEPRAHQIQSDERRKRRFFSSAPAAKDQQLNMRPVRLDGRCPSPSVWRIRNLFSKQRTLISGVVQWNHLLCLLKRIFKSPTIINECCSQSLAGLALKKDEP